MCACLAVAIICFVPANLADKLMVAAIPASVSLLAYLGGRLCIKDAARLDEEDREDEEDDSDEPPGSPGPPADLGQFPVHF